MVPPTVTLRLFAAARQALGGGTFVITASTVGEAIDAALARPGGDRLRPLLASCTVWRNGRAAGSDESLVDGDEVAILPPVSGG